MGNPTPRRELADTPLANWLREQIDAREKWGIRTLARRMNPSDPEIARRALNRYMYEGAYPNDEIHAQIASALDVAVSEVPAAPRPFPRHRQAA